MRSEVNDSVEPKTTRTPITHLNRETTTAKITAERFLSRVRVDVSAKGRRTSEAFGCRSEVISDRFHALSLRSAQTHYNEGIHIVLLLLASLLLPPRQLLEAQKRRQRLPAPKQQRRRRQRREALLQAMRQRKGGSLQLAELSMLATETSCGR